jgi:NAD(P)H-dependent nitrite reductase large subunit/NAD(P)H-dependent nitrite reductase small subunit
MTAPHGWQSVCAVEEICVDTGVCALVDGRQIAIFRTAESGLHALDNHDPASRMNVLARGIVGDLDGVPVVASPLYKQHYSLVTGACMEDPSVKVAVYPVRVMSGQVWVRPEPRRQRPAGRRKLVVVGNGMAGMRTVEELLGLAPEAYEITVFGAEPHGNYNRILLSPVLAGEKRIDEIMLHDHDWYREHGVTLHAGDPVVAIDRVRRTVTSQSGVVAAYDRLLLATGSQPFMPPIAGNQLPGVIAFRDLKDVETMVTAAGQFRNAIVIGGGLLGLEAANGLLRRGMAVTVVHLQDTLMERQLDPMAAGMLRASLETRGLTFRMPAQTVAILGDARVTGVRFADGVELPADLVVMAVGIRPHIDLARAAGLRCDRGVLVDDTLQTFDPCIYAVGECVQHRNSTYGLVAPLWEQATVCARHLAEVGVSRYRGSRVSTQLKVTGIALFSAGDFRGTARSESLVFKDLRRGIYKRLVLEDDKVVGAVLYGDTQDGPWYFELINSGSDVGPIRDRLLFGEAAARPLAS